MQLTHRMRAALAAGAAGLALLAALHAWRWADAHAGVDAYQFWVVGRYLHEPGPASVYATQDRARLGALALERARRNGPPWLVELAAFRSVLETYSTPLLYSAAAAVALADYESWLRAYRLLQLVALVAAVVALARALGYPASGGWIAAAAFASLYQPFRADLQVGNVGAFQLVMVAAWLGLALRPSTVRNIAAGMVLGAAVAFKPNLALVPALLCVHLLATRQNAVLGLQLAGGAAGAGAAVLLSSLAFGTGACWPEWFAALRSLPQDIVDVARGNFAPARVAMEHFGAWAAAGTMILPMAVSVGVIAAWWRRDPDAGARAIAPVLALGCLLPLVSTQLAWHHYFVLAIPALMVLGSPRPGAGLVRPSIGAACFIGISVRPFLDPGALMPAGTAALIVAVSTWVLLLAMLAECLPPRALRSNAG